MFRGRGGNHRRSHDRPYNSNFRGKSSDRRSGELLKSGKSDSGQDSKTEWVSYKRPVSADKLDNKDEKTVAPKIKTEEESDKELCNLNVQEKNIDVKAQTSKPQHNVEPSVDQVSGSKIGKPGEKKFSGRCRLFVANMNNSTTEDELRTLFSEFGETGELYINKDKGFGFIRMDYRHNAELAKGALDKKLFKGRCIQVRFATHASAIELHGLDDFASNEYIEQTMSQFGTVERAVVVCDDRGRSKGYAIVEFEWKKSAQKVLDRFKEEMFVLGRLPKPVFVKPRSQLDEEEGIHEDELAKNPVIKNEREFIPRFISPSSFEYTWAKKWRDLFIEEEDKKAKLEQELQDARYQLEMEMESALREQEAVKIREGMIEELQRRQEELHRLEEEMRIRQEMNMRAREQMDRGRQKPFDEKRGFSPRQQGHQPQSRDNASLPPQRRDGFPENLSQQNEIIMHQQAELEMRRGELLRVAGMQQGMLGLRPELLQGHGGNLPPLRPPMGGLPHALAGSLGGSLTGPPRGPLQPGMPPIQNLRPPRPHLPQEGPPRRDFSPRGGGERFDHKRPRRD